MNNQFCIFIKIFDGYLKKKYSRTEADFKVAFEKNLQSQLEKVLRCLTVESRFNMFD